MSNSNKKLIILFWLIFILILFFLGGCSKEYTYSDLKAIEGVIDITQCCFDEDVIRLDGQWEFYWNELIEPRELRSTMVQKTGYIDVPSSWNKYLVNGNELSGDGYAAYRLLFINNKNSRMGIKIPRILTSYNLWINDELIAAAGTVGKSRETAKPQYMPQVVFFESNKGENEIFIQVSNFYHRSGGILESLILGSENQIIKLCLKNIAYELFLFGSLMIIGVYHLALFFFRKKNVSPLYFGLFCIFVGVRTLLVGERFLIYLFPNFNWEIAHKIQTLTFYLGVPVVLMLFRSVFPKDFHLKNIKIIQAVGGTFGLLVIFTPAKIFTVANPLFQVFTIIVIIYIIVIFTKILIRKEKGIKLVIIGALALILASLNDIIFLSIWMNDRDSSFLRFLFRTGNLSSVGQLIFVFTNSLVLAQKFSDALEHEEVVTAKLKEINLKLDDLVEKRTQALEESKEKIKQQKIELEKANYALHLLALKDPLTGLWNRRHYDDTIHMEWNRCLRHKCFISLLMLDIDYFKAYNDCYGHKAGDECLARISNAMKNLFNRAGDLVARYGGEEFVVIMPGLGKDEAIKMALLVKKSIEELNIPHKCSPTSSWVTASIGVTSMIPNNKSSLNNLFLEVDKALYKAKAAGRNKVIYGDGSFVSLHKDKEE